MQGGTSFWRSLAIQWRTIWALLMREVITRFGRHNIGFFWLFIEPTIYCVGVMCTRILLHEKFVMGVPPAAFVFSGYSTILLWRNCGNRCACAITPNLSLLYHHNVRTIDVIVARIILELSGCAMSFMMLMGIFIFTGITKPPCDIVLLIEGYLMEAWFAGALAIWVCACSEMSDFFDRIWHPMTYLMLPISGFAWMVDWLPAKYQWLAMCMPMWDGCEMLRDGYFGNVIRCHYSVTYLCCFNLGLLLLGLIMLNLWSREVEPQ